MESTIIIEDLFDQLRLAGMAQTLAGHATNPFVAPDQRP